MSAPWCPVVPRWIVCARVADGEWRMAASGEAEKRCTWCRSWLPWDTEFFRHDHKCRDGLRARCRACEAESNIPAPVLRERLQEIAA